jgi:Mitochondrial carrier protein
VLLCCPLGNLLGHVACTQEREAWALLVSLVHACQGPEVTVTKGLCRSAGTRGFAAGLAPRLLTIVPGNMISWLVYEKVKQAWIV